MTSRQKPSRVISDCYQKDPYCRILLPQKFFFNSSLNYFITLILLEYNKFFSISRWVFKRPVCELKKNSKRFKNCSKVPNHHTFEKSSSKYVYPKHSHHQHRSCHIHPQIHSHYCHCRLSPNGLLLVHL